MFERAMIAVRKRLGKAAWLLFLAQASLVSAPSGAPAMDLEFLEQPVEGEVKEISAFDLDRDGVEEILVSSNLYADGEATRFLDAYRLVPSGDRRQGKAFSRILHWQVVPEAVFWDTGVLPGKEAAGGLFFLSNEGLWRLPIPSGGEAIPELVAHATPFLATGQDNSFSALDFLKDWNGDGVEEVLVPCVREAVFYGPAADRTLVPVDRVRVLQNPMYNNNVLLGREIGSYHFLSTFMYPLLVDADLDGDGRKDLLVIRAGKAYRHLRGPDGKLATDGSPWDLDIRSPEEKTRRLAPLAFRVADFNGDGCADVVVHKGGENLYDWKSETAIFLGSRGAVGREPAWRLPARGFLSGVTVEDLDGDGHPDMAVWSMQMGLWPVIQILLRRVVLVEASFHYWAGEKLYLEEPEAERKFEFRIDSKERNLFHGIAPTTQADFDGDGINDLVAEAKEGVVGIYLGRPRKGFDGDPAAEAPAPGVNFVRTSDVDGDGRVDFYAYQAREKDSSFYVWLNRPGKKTTGKEPSRGEP